MGRHRCKWTEDRYLQDLKNGVSQGTGVNYMVNDKIVLYKRPYKFTK